MEYFKLFANCIMVKGFKRSIITDLQKNKLHLVPNDLEEIIRKSTYSKIDQIYTEYGVENQTVIHEYFQNLIDLELGFFCSETELNFFPTLNLDFNLPFKISNSIIENIYEIDVYKNILHQLESLGCQYIEIVFYDLIENSDLEKILNLFFYSSIKHIGLYIKFDSTKNKKYIKTLTSKKLRLTKIIIHSSEVEKALSVKDYNLNNILYTKAKIESFNFCGAVKKEYFAVGMYHFTESQRHNTCLNLKLSIDKNGNIKNCPSMLESFGNIKDTTLEEALNNPNFKKYWNINKDQIEVCKDCEFRHVCTDCRAYMEDPENQYSKPLKCGYNPYTNEWSEWSTNPLKQKAIKFYGMQDLIKKNE